MVLKPRKMTVRWAGCTSAGNTELFGVKARKREAGEMYSQPFTAAFRFTVSYRERPLFCSVRGRLCRGPRVSGGPQRPPQERWELNLVIRWVIKVPQGMAGCPMVFY